MVCARGARVATVIIGSTAIQPHHRRDVQQSTVRPVTDGDYVSVRQGVRGYCTIMLGQVVSACRDQYGRGEG